MDQNRNDTVAVVTQVVNPTSLTIRCDSATTVSSVQLAAQLFCDSGWIVLSGFTAEATMAVLDRVAEMTRVAPWWVWSGGSSEWLTWATSYTLAGGGLRTGTAND